MPIYEYRCNDCSNEFEELVSSNHTGNAGIACPKCNSHHVERKLSTFAASVSSTSSGPMPCGAPSRSGCGSGGFT